MVDAALLSRAKTMSPADRLERIGAAWGALSPADVPATEEDKYLFDVRLADLENDPQGQSLFPEIRARLKKNCLGLQGEKGMRRNALRLFHRTRADRRREHNRPKMDEYL